MEPRTIVVQSKRCRQELIFGSLSLELNLPTSIIFKEKALVRLHSAAGLDEEIHVSTTFSERVPFGDTLRRHLAIVAPASLPGPWNPVDGGFVSNVSSLTLTKISGEPFTSIPEKNFTLVLEFTRENGGPGGNPRL